MPSVNPFGQANARAVAYDLATRAFAGGLPFDQIWDEDSGLAALPQRDRALAIHLSAGVLRFKRRLDARARLLTDGKSDDLNEAVQWVLRFGLFQVVDCDRIPPHAAVSTAVDAVKVVSHKGIAGMVNAVLRRAVRERDDLVMSTAADGTPAGRADCLSMPEWLADLLCDRFGADAFARIERWANHPPTYYYRLAKNGGGLERLQQVIEAGDLGSVRPHREFPEYVGVSTAALAASSPLFAEPLGWVQNPAAGLVVQLLDPQPGETILDLFAAPGGKSMAIAERVGPEGQVLAVDRSEQRLKRVIDNKARLGFDNILPVVGDVSDLGPRTALRVLADVPCSALGTLPKNPEVRWTKKPVDVDRLARSQRIWLSAASSHVDPGGVLVYATCTL
ncbi:MAG TPA: transcription antitermination factor NusB, partial [Acidobacteriota bacterium]|nr:transcription antitermination factor NusB [Acidobacteriota bacterium]